LRVTELEVASESVLRRWIGPLAHGPEALGQKYCLLVDGDRTLAPEDTGRLVTGAFGMAEEIRTGFERHGYSPLGFATMAAIVSAIPIHRYLEESLRVAEGVALYRVWRSIFDAVAAHMPILVVTAGIPQVWRSVLDLHGYPHIAVVGGCHRDLDHALVTRESKALLVSMLQQAGWKVVAAGDSRIDLPMLIAADLPLFVPDTKGSPALRACLGQVPGVKHLIVDDQRFEELNSVTDVDIIRYLSPVGEERAH
jgi:phosphoserine phosphatase